MASLLISGPAGAGKSEIARQELERRRLEGEPAIAADFQALYAALSLQERGTNGRYPLRQADLLPMAEYARRAVMTGAAGAGIDVVATNSDGDINRRRRLLAELGEGATERVVDPGRDAVAARLSDASGNLSAECEAAIGRWYGRL